MLLVCKQHVLEGIKILNAPQLSKIQYNGPCKFCGKKAEYELFYFLTKRKSVALR